MIHDALIVALILVGYPAAGLIAAFIPVYAVCLWRERHQTPKES